MALPSLTADELNEDFFVSVVTASELLHGVYRARDSHIRARRAAFVDAVLDRFPMVEIDLPIARTHARLWAELAAEGTPIGPHDLWLAATCVAQGLRMITLNGREFERVAGLIVESWDQSRE